jgi:multidrug efflux pump subunit AcrA (membrane-fusion protein)
VQRHFQDGQYVNQGDLLFTLDDAQPRAALALAQAELKSAQASLRQAQQLLTRYQQLKNNHSISRNDVDNARMQRDVAAAAVEQAKRASPAADYAGYTRIDSPVTGRVATALSRRQPGEPDQRRAGGYGPARSDSRLFRLDEAAFFSKAGQHADIGALKQAWLAQIDRWQAGRRGVDLRR